MPESITPTVVSLTPHPAAGAGPVRHLRAAVRWQPASRQLSLTYRLEADAAALRLPGPAAAQRRDGLWRHTCLEAFLRAADGTRYFEFNFSPSGEWAAYRFDAPRQGMQPLELAREPAPQASHGPDGLQLAVELELPGPPGTPLQLGLGAVVESAEGHFGYWALRHGGPAPDFHDPESFTLRLGAQATDAPA